MDITRAMPVSVAALALDMLDAGAYVVAPK